MRGLGGKVTYDGGNDKLMGEEGPRKPSRPMAAVFFFSGSHGGEWRWMSKNRQQ
jgi:hypothetical protein